jgi:DNA-binding response OmpR family regulator
LTSRCPELTRSSTRAGREDGKNRDRFKRDPGLRSIPVIFISGMQGTDDKVEAFRLGAVDYIRQPWQDQEVLERVKTHLRLRRLGVEVGEAAPISTPRSCLPSAPWIRKRGQPSCADPLTVDAPGRRCS